MSERASTASSEQTNEPARGPQHISIKNPGVRRLFSPGYYSKVEHELFLIARLHKRPRCSGNTWNSFKPRSPSLGNKTSKRACEHCQTNGSSQQCQTMK